MSARRELRKRENLKKNTSGLRLAAAEESDDDPERAQNSPGPERSLVPGAVAVSRGVSIYLRIHENEPEPEAELEAEDTLMILEAEREEIIRAASNQQKQQRRRCIKISSIVGGIIVLLAIVLGLALGIDRSATTVEPIIVVNQTASQAPQPTRVPTQAPTTQPTKQPVVGQTKQPSPIPTKKPTPSPTQRPTQHPTKTPSASPTTAAPTKYDFPVLPIGNDGMIYVSDTEDEGKLFFAEVEDFPIPLDLLPVDERGEVKTVLRVENLDSGAHKSVMVKLESGRIRGWYNPEQYAEVDDFWVGDRLVAKDYGVLIPGRECTRVPFEVFTEPGTVSLGWDRDPSNIRIGRVGLVGNFYNDFDLLFHLDTPVSMMWTDAVNANIDVFQSESSWAYWPRAVEASPEFPSLREFEAPLVGDIRVYFKDAGLFDLDSLVSQRDGGGAHIAFCA